MATAQESPTVNDLLNLLSEAANEIVNLSDRDNIVVERIRQMLEEFRAMESTLERAIRMSVGQAS